MGDSGNRAIPLGSTVLILLALGSVLFFRSPLKSIRPPITAGPETSAFRDQNVPARLWQDPIAAVDETFTRQKQQIRSRSGDGQALINAQLPVVNRIENLKRGLREDQSVRLLPVIMTSGYEAVSSEARRRERQAVIHALAERGYAPESGSRIGYFGTCWRRGSHDENEVRLVTQRNLGNRPFFNDSTNNNQLPGDTNQYAFIPVPFEWFGSDREQQDTVHETEKILILYLAEDRLLTDYVAMLTNLLVHVGDQIPWIISQESYDHHVHVVGPATSTGLRKIMAFRSQSRQLPPSRVQELVFHSSRATAPAEWLEESIASTTKRSGTSLPGIRILRNLADDHQALALAVGEIKLRVSRQMKGQPNHVALFVELDSHYGRAMRDGVKQALVSVNEDLSKDIKGDKATKESTNWILHSYPLFRGLDGSTPYVSSPDPGSYLTSQDEGSPEAFGGIGLMVSGDTRTRTLPFGRQRIDVFRRQADQLVRDTEDLPGDGRLVAAGVLGSDVFDKLLVIQALRDRFPELLIFTTDLDAMFVHPDLNHATRNLIVASSHGLMPLDPEATPGSEQVAQFRNNYQTATYLATLAALDPGSENEDHATQTPPPPRIFEIGKDRAYDLSAGAHVPDKDNLANALLVAALMGLLALPVLLVDQRTRSHLRRQRLWLGVGVTLGTGLVMLAVLVLVIRFNSPTMEPFALMAGISIWPSVLIQIAAAGLASYTLLKLFIQAPESRLRTETTARLTDFVPQVTGIHPGPRRVFCFFRDHTRTIVRERLGPIRSSSAAVPGLPMESVWGDYACWDQPGFRWLRIAAGIVIAIFTFLVMERSMPRPMAPARGELAQSVNEIATGVAGLLFLALFFFVIDVLLQNRKLVTICANNHVSWPDRLQVTRHREIGLPPGPEGHSREHIRLLERVQTLKVVATATRSLGWKLFAPFMVLLVIQLSRLDVFDNWGYPRLSQIYLTFLAATTLIGCFQLHRLARDFKQDIVGDIAAARRAIVAELDYSVEAPLAMQEGGADRIMAEGQAAARLAGSQQRALLRLEQEAAAVRSGIFQTWSRHPMIRASVLAVLVLIALLEQSMRFG